MERTLEEMRMVLHDVLYVFRLRRLLRKWRDADQDMCNYFANRSVVSRHQKLQQALGEQREIPAGVVIMPALHSLLRRMPGK